MANRERPPRIPGKAQPSASLWPAGPTSQPLGADRPEVGKYSAWEFFDRKVIPRDELDYRQFLQRDPDGKEALQIAKLDATLAVEQDFTGEPSDEPIFLERTEPIVISPKNPPWSRDLGPHEMRLVIEYTVDVSDQERTFHITLYITVTPLDRKRSKFREQTIGHTFDHRASASSSPPPKKWKASRR